MNELTPEILAMLGGTFLSLLFGYIPGFKDWYEAKTSEQKALIMAGLLVVPTVGFFLLNCGGYIPGTTCDSRGALNLAGLYLLTLVVNQGVHNIAKNVKRS